MSNTSHARHAFEKFHTNTNAGFDSPRYADSEYAPDTEIIVTIGVHTDLLRADYFEALALLKHRIEAEIEVFCGMLAQTVEENDTKARQS